MCSAISKSLSKSCNTFGEVPNFIEIFVGENMSIWDTDTSRAVVTDMLTYVNKYCLDADEPRMMQGQGLMALDSCMTPSSGRLEAFPPCEYEYPYSRTLGFLYDHVLLSRLASAAFRG